MAEKSEGYLPPWYPLPVREPSSQQVIRAMENQVSQNHVIGNQLPGFPVPPEDNLIPQFPYLTNPFYQNSLPQNPPQNPSFRNMPTAQTLHHDLYYPSDIRWDLCASILQNESTPSRQYNQFFVDSIAPSMGSTQGDVNIDLASSMRRLSIGPTLRELTDAYPRYSGAQFSVNEDIRNRSSSRFNSFAYLQNGISNFVPGMNAFAARASDCSISQYNEGLGYSARPSSTRNRVRPDLVPRRSIEGSSSSFVSPLLYNPRNRQRSTYSSVEELRGRVCLVAKDQQGCRFLQKKVEERNPVYIELIFLEVKDELHELIVHQFANYVIQKLVDVVNEDQMTLLVRAIVSSEEGFFNICNNVHGTRVIQKLLDPTETPPRQYLTQERKSLLVTPEQKSLVVSALKKVAVRLSKGHNGQHVVQKCLQKIPNEYTKELVEEIANYCFDLAVDKNGCCVLQQCLLYAKEEQKGRLVADIVSNALLLAENSFGNYVVQFVLTMRIPQVTADILSQLAGHFFTLSMNRCSSHVVETCMKETGEEQRTGIIKEIINHPDVLDLMLDLHGNYVIQTAWRLSEGRPIRQALDHLVSINFPFLQNHVFGKNVLAAVKGNKYLAR